MATMSLDEILFDTEEPERTELLKKFMMSDEPVKLKPMHGTFRTRFRGEVITIPPSGRWVGRASAIYLLLDHGRDGKYRGKHRPTMMTETILDNLPREEQEYWREKKNVVIDDNYVYHDLTAESDQLSVLAVDEEVEAAAV